MSAPIQPLRQPPPGSAPSLADVALQRQGRLLESGRHPAGPDKTQGTARPETANPPPAAESDHVSLSARALHSLAASGASADATHTPPNVPQGTARRAFHQHAAPASGTAAPVLLPGQWPTAGVSAPVHAWISAVVQHLTHAMAPQQVARIQPWPDELVRLLEGASEAPEGTVGGAFPVLQTWLVRQGILQTPEGPRSFSLTLKAPLPWLQQQAPPAELPPQSGAAPLVFAGRPQALLAGAFALVLQSAETAARTSALMTMEFAPLAHASTYGRDLLQTRQDPWLQMAVLQASGHLPKEESGIGQRDAALCHTPGCPYADRAVCPQPFCLALQTVSQVDPVEPAPSA